jgi:OOP family OmpA-OmpF porin
MALSTKQKVGATLGVIAVGVILYLLLKKKPKNEEKALKDAYDNLVFETGKAIIKPESLPFLDEVAQVMNDARAKDWTLKIDGYTDNVGSEEFNKKLSVNRANAVKTYLTTKGLDATRITATGFGESNPIAPNDTDEGRAKNRRVTFTIVKPQPSNVLPTV